MLEKKNQPARKASERLIHKQQSARKGLELLRTMSKPLGRQATPNAFNHVKKTRAKHTRSKGTRAFNKNHVLSIGTRALEAKSKALQKGVDKEQIAGKYVAAFSIRSNSLGSDWST